jgi:formylmethanofuran dehydrogenase subunit E
MGLAGLARTGIETPVSKPTGLVIVETDGCFVDGIEVATGAAIGHRTLRVVDMGKIAHTDGTGMLEVRALRAFPSSLAPGS